MRIGGFCPEISQAAEEKREQRGIHPEETVESVCTAHSRHELVLQLSDHYGRVYRQIGIPKKTGN